MNPFESDMKKSEFFLEGESEQQSLDSINRRIESMTTKKKVFTLPKTLLLAASFITLLAVSFFLFRNNSSSLQSIAESHFDHYPNYVELQVRGDENSSNLKEAYLSYDKKEYSLAIKSYNSVKEELKPKDVFYLSIALLGEAKWQDANQKLESVSGQLDEQYFDAYYFYHSLSLVGSGDKALAIAELDKLTNARSPFYKKALILRDKLLRN